MVKFADTPRDKDAKKMQQLNNINGSFLQQFLNTNNLVNFLIYKIFLEYLKLKLKILQNHHNVINNLSTPNGQNIHSSFSNSNNHHHQVSSHSHLHSLHHSNSLYHNNTGLNGGSHGSNSLINGGHSNNHFQHNLPNSHQQTNMVAGLSSLINNSTIQNNTSNSNLPHNPSINTLNNSLLHQANNISSIGINGGLQNNNNSSSSSGIPNINNLLLVQQLLNSSFPQLQNVANNPVALAVSAVASNQNNNGNSFLFQVFQKAKYHRWNIINTFYNTLV